MKRIVFYTNQFFGQIGGEEYANTLPQWKDGAIGSANLFQQKLKDAVLIRTIICGDNYFSENMSKAGDEIMEMIRTAKPDMVIAGPAFNAGRFGIACGEICSRVEKEINIPAITAMYEENPAVSLYKAETTIVKSGKSAASMRKTIEVMMGIIQKRLDGIELETPEPDLIPKGVRVNVFKENTGAERALDMLVAKLNHKPYVSEVPIPSYDTVQAAEPIHKIEEACIALVTSGGIVPIGNPNHLPAATARFYSRYDISGITALAKGDYESVHAGYDPVYGNDNPNRIVPLDLMKEMERSGEIGKLYPYFLSTTGNSTSVADASRMGKEMAMELMENGVNGVILTST